MSDAGDSVNLTVRIKKGNKEAFEELFRMHYGGLCVYVNSLIHDIDASEDVIQSLFLRIWENRENLSPESNLDGYIFTSARNAAFNYIKHQRIEADWQKQMQSASADDGLSFSGNMEDLEFARSIFDALDKLPLKRRIIFILSRYYKMTYKEIADTQNISVKTVETQISRSLHFLTEFFITRVTPK